MFIHMNRFALLLVTANVVAACTGTTIPVEPNFGARYRVMLEPESPVLGATTLSVTVSYGGCRGNHDFVLRHRIQMDTAEIWLQKITPDQQCDMLVTERRAFVIPEPLRTAAVVTLSAPDIDPHRLRP